jgi:hypothetical protein
LRPIWRQALGAPTAAGASCSPVCTTASTRAVWGGSCLGQGGQRRRTSDYWELAKGLGWSLHPYLGEPFGARLAERAFAPLAALSPSTHEALFGPRAGFPKTRLGTPEESLAALSLRLHARHGNCPHEQPVLLTRRPGELQGQGQVGWLDGALEICQPLRDRSGRPIGWLRGPAFRFDWADLWLFPDAHGLTHRGNAMLALRMPRPAPERTSVAA